MSEWFNASGSPTNRGSLLSLPVREQFTQIGDAFAKLPDFTGNGSKLLAFNAGATAVEAITAIKQQTNGIIVGTGANLSPTSGGVGYLQLAGSGYTGYATLDATGMYIGHTSGSRTLVLQTDETDRIKIGAAGGVTIGPAAAPVAAWGNALAVSAANNATAAIELVMDGSPDELAGYLSYSQSGGSLLAFNVYSYAAIPLILGANNTERFRIGSDGRIAIGAGGLAASVDTAVRGSTSDSSRYGIMVINSSSDTTLSVRNDGLINTGTRANSPYNATTASAVNMHVSSDGNLARSTSSRRYKKNISDSAHGLTALMGLRSVIYQGTGQYDGNRYYGGLIAEEVHDAGLGEFVEYNNDGEPESVMYTHLVALCIKSIQELKGIVDAIPSAGAGGGGGGRP